MAVRRERMIFWLNRPSAVSIFSSTFPLAARMLTMRVAKDPKRAARVSTRVRSSSVFVNA